MARCNECNSVIAKKDIECFVCGEPVPGIKKRSFLRKKESKPAPPPTPLSNVLFLASLALTGFSFFSGHKMSLSVSATLSGVLLAGRIISDRIAMKQRLPLGPVTVTRLDS